ncbi:MAG: NYN domain-containing protein [Defluviitaleaceae bacterium]|nr:NYN domain-containing protein [Defluviitaleaceae bacterium]
MASNTVIFYDIENLMGIFSSKSNTVLYLEEIYRRVLDMDGVTGVSIQRAYADWSVPNHKNLRSSTLQVGIEPVQIFNTNQHDKLKNAADVSLIIDAVDLAARRDDIENFVIASGDGIFAFLAKKLHEHGKRVIGCSFSIVTNNIFRNACDYFIGLEKTDTALFATTSGKNVNHPQSVVPIGQPMPEPKKATPLSVHGKLPKTKYTEALEAAGLEVFRDLGDKSGCMHVVRQLMEAVFVEATKGQPGLEVSIFTNYVNHYLPGFKVRRHGFMRLWEYLALVLTGSPYCIYSMPDKKNVLLIAPREDAEGDIVEDVKGLLITTEDGSRYNTVFNVPTGQSFIYSVTPQAPAAETPSKQPEEPAKKPNNKKTKQEPARPEETPATASTKKRGRPKKEQSIPTEEPAEANANKEISIRRWIKSQFEAVAKLETIPPAEAKKLTTAKYSSATFGVRTPIFKELKARDNIEEARIQGGKLKYWKEPFTFNGRRYLIFKEWVQSQHKERFIKWLEAKLVAQ